MEKLKKILASILCINILLSGSPVLLFAAAPEETIITGITPEGNVYNITPQDVFSDTGVRSYTDFTLKEGDTANLIFTSDYNKFINLVDNKINIWGVVNTTNSSGAFTNGNAIFVSPNGIVIGSSGVLNVGSVSLVSTTSSAYDTYKTDQTTDNYKNLISNASGDVLINGKINAADTVEVVSKNINLQDSEVYTGKDVFDSLVNNTAVNATNVTVRNGKVILSARSNVDANNESTVSSQSDVTSTILIDDSTIVSGEVAVEAESSISVTTEITSTKSLLEKDAKAEVIIDDSIIKGTDIKITATGNYLLKPGKATGVAFKLNTTAFQDAMNKAKEKGYLSADFLSENGFNKLGGLGKLIWDELQTNIGAASSANITIRNGSTIDASGNLDVLTNANSNSEIAELNVVSSEDSGKAAEAGLMSVGSKTTSKVLIQDSSNLKAEGNLNTNALSTNNVSLKVEANVKTKAAFTFPFLISSVTADTGIKIDNSILTGKQTGVESFAYEKMNVDIANTANVGTDTSFRGSGAAVVVLIESADIVNNIDIVGTSGDKSTVTSTDGDLSIQSLNYGEYSTSVSAKTKEKSKEDSDKDGDTPAEGSTTANVLKVGGSLILSDVNSTANVNIGNSTIDSAGKLQIRSFIFNKNVNNATAMNTSKDTQLSFSAGIALIISDVDNNSNVTVKDSDLKSKDSMNIDAVTELPGLKGEIFLGTKQFNIRFDFKAGAANTFNPDVDFSFDIKSVFKNPTKTDLKPVFKLSGFFNNLAGAYTTSETAGAEASLVVDKVTNNATVEISNNSTLTSEGNIAVNAVNSMAYSDGAGFSRFKMKLSEITKLGQIWKPEDEDGKGAGGAILIQDFDNTATVKIDDNTKLTAENGNIELNAASEQLYIDLTKLASKADNVDIAGATNVQSVGGKVSVEVNNNTVINAQDVQINAGKATAEFFSKLKSVTVDEKTSTAGIDFAQRRDVDDHVTSIDFTGAYSDAKESGEKSVEAAIGAAVNVKNVKRTVEAVVDNSTIVASSGNVSVNAQSKTYMFDLIMAGAVTSEASSASANNNVKADKEDDNWQKQAEDADSPAAAPADNPVQDDVEDAVEDEGDSDDGEAPAPTPDSGETSDSQASSYNSDDKAAPAANAAANPANRTNWSLSAAGSVGVFTDKTKIKATVKDSTLTASEGEINVTSDYRTISVLASGGVSDSSTMGFGAAVNLYFRNGETSALVDNSELTSKKNSVNAKEQSTTVDIVAGLVKSDTSSNFAFGGSFAYNTYKPVIKAEVSNGTTIVGTADIDAKGDITNVDIAIGAEFTLQKKNPDQSTSSFQAASSFAGSMDYLGSNIVAQVDGSTISGAEAVSVDAKDEVNIVGVSAGVGVTTAPVEGQAKLDGSLSIVYANNNIKAIVNNSNVSATGDIVLSALNNTEVFNLDGVIDYSKANMGVGANGAVNINIHKNNVIAEVTNNTSEEKTVASSDGKLSIVADSQEKLNIINAAAAIGKSTSMLASVVSLGIIKNTVSAKASGILNLNSKTGVDVIAEDNAFILSRGGTLAGVYEGQKSAGLAVSVNIDKMYKNVSATIKDATVNTTGNVNIQALSDDGMGASKAEDGDLSNLDAVLDRADDEDYGQASLNGKFSEWDMFYNLAGASDSFLTLAGSFSLKIVKNNISATVDNSTIVAKNVTVAADETTSKNLVAGSLSGTFGRAAVAGQLIRPTDSSTIEAVVKNGTTVTVDEEGKLNITATETKNDKTILVAGAASNNVGVSVNGLFNLNKSKLTALMNGSTLKKGSLNINSEEKIDGLRIMIAAGGANQGESLALNVALNTYKQIAEALVLNSTFGYEDLHTQYIDVNAKNTIKTGDYLLGLGFTMQGASQGVVGIKNNYSNKTYARIADSTLSNTFDINVKTLSHMETDNRSLVAVGGGQGASIGANIIVNDDSSDNKATIHDSTINDNYGTVTVTVNEENGKAVQDSIDNMVFAFGFEFQGAQIAANIVLNHYRNNAEALFDLSNINKTNNEPTTNNLNVRSYSDRDIDNVSVMVGANFMGAALNFNLVKNEVESVTRAAINATDRTVALNNNIDVKAYDRSLVASKLGTVGGGAVSAVPIASVKLDYIKGLSLAEINGGTITAKDVIVNQELIFGYKQTGVGISIGGATIAGNVSVIRFGADSDYSELERRSKIDETVNQSKNIISSAGISDSPASLSESGSHARISGATVNADGDVKIASNVTYKGYDGDTLKLTNVNVDAGGASAGVGVLSFKQNTVNTAEVSNNSVITAKSLDVNAAYKDNVDIDSVSVELNILKFSGGSSAYKNTATNKAIINDSSVITTGNVNVISRLDSKASTSATDVSLKFGQIAVAGYEVVGDSKTIAYVDSSAVKSGGDLTIKATGSAEYTGSNHVVSISPIDLGFISTTANNSSGFSAQIITKDNGTGAVDIDVKNLNIQTGYNKLSVSTKNNAVRISGFDIVSNDAKANMSARFYSGLGKDNGDQNRPVLGVIKVSGTTTVETAKKLGNDNIKADATVDSVNISIAGVNVGTTARAENNVISHTYFNVSSVDKQGFTTGNLKINAELDASTNGKAGDTSGNLVGVKSLSVETESKSRLKVLFGGNNTINGEAVLYANHTNDVKTDLSTFSAGILANVDLSDLDSVLSAETQGVFGGTLKYNKFTANFKTLRYGTLNLSTSGGGAVHVGSPTAKNSITGTSKVSFSGLSSGNAGNGDFFLTNYSDTTIDSVSHSSSGGFVAVQNDGKYLTLDTSSSVVVDGVNIGSDSKAIGTFSIDVKNNELVKDSSSNKGGGFVLVSSDKSDNTYTSKSSVTVNNSNIYSTNFNLSATTNISTDTDDYVKYQTVAGGLVPVNGVDIRNTLNQENTIDINNSHIESTGLGTVTVGPTFQFQQDGGASADGLSAWPSAEARLTSNNTNTVNVSAGSVVKAQILEFKFDANGILRSYAHVKARDAWSDPDSYSSVDLTVNNNLNVNGWLWSTMFLDIEFMGASNIEVSQEAFTQHNAVAPSVDVDGHATKTINNTFTVADNNVSPGYGEIAGRGTLKTERDMNISFSKGSGSVSSNNHWKKVYYILFGKKKTGSDKSNSHSDYTPKFVLDGDVVAGKGEDKILYINSDGTVDKTKSKGFADGEYEIVNNPDYTGFELKQQRLIYLEDSLKEVNGEITILNSRIREIDAEQQMINRANAEYQKFSTEFNIKTMTGQIEIDDFQNVLAITKADIKELVGDQYDQATMDAIISQLDGFEDLNKNKVEEIINNMGISQAKKTAFISGFEQACDKVAELDLETGYNDLNFSMFGYKKDDGTIVLGLSPNGEGGYEEIDEMHETLARINNISTKLTEEKIECQTIRTENEKVRGIIMEALVESRLKTEEQYALEYNPYAYVFKDMYLFGASHVNIEGLTGKKNTKFDVAIESKNNKLQFKIKQPGGVKVINYSDYSLVFGSIDMTDKDGQKSVQAVIEKFKDIDLSKLVEVESLTSSLVINGEDRDSGDFPRNLVVPETDPAEKIYGVEIQSLRNEANPYYKGPENHSVDYTGNITIKGNLTSDDHDVKIFAQSGNIIINGLNYQEGRYTDIYAPQGVIQIGGIKDEDADFYRLKLGSTEKITAGKGIVFIADDIVLNARVTSGITNHTFVLPSYVEKNNLDYDPTTGKADLIPTIEGSNVNAIFVSEDGRNEKIYLFDIVNYQGYVRFQQPYRIQSKYVPPGQISGQAIININHGFGTVSVTEDPNSGLLNQYPLILGDIVNVSDTYDDVAVLSSFTESYPIKINNIYLNGELATKSGEFLSNLVVNSDNDGYANTSISTIGRGVHIENNIYNGMFEDSTGYFQDNISYDNLFHKIVIEDSRSMINVNAAVVGSGGASIKTSRRSDLNITRNGSIDFPIAYIWDVTSINDPIEARNVTVDEMDFKTYAEYIDVENILVRQRADFTTSGGANSKKIVVNNLNIRRESYAPVKIFTDYLGAFELSINDTNIVETNAPVVYSFENVLVSNPLGYHTFETISLFKASEMTEETYTKSRTPFGGISYEKKILDEEVELIEEVNENSYLREMKK